MPDTFPAFIIDEPLCEVTYTDDTDYTLLDYNEVYQTMVFSGAMDTRTIAFSNVHDYITDMTSLEDDAVFVIKIGATHRTVPLI